MMTQMTNQETDTALILENELKRRVREVTREIIRDEIQREVKRIFLEQKDSMLMEVSISVGKTLQVVENEGRRPLWEANPEEFGLTNDSLNTHHLMSKQDALREQTPSV
jgi:hypothetical protein